MLILSPSNLPTSPFYFFFPSLLWSPPFLGLSATSTSLSFPLSSKIFLFYFKLLTKPTWTGKFLQVLWGVDQVNYFVFSTWKTEERQKPQLINKFLSPCNRCYTSFSCVPLWLLKTSVSHIVSLVTFSMMTLNKHCIFSHLIPHHRSATDTHCRTKNMVLTFTGEAHILKNSWNETTTNVKCDY